jgi:hypothetical protein
MAESEKQVREVQKTVRDLDQGADEMEKHAGELNSEIDSVRQEFQRRRNDENVPGLPPEPETEDEKATEESPGDPDET